VVAVAYILRVMGLDVPLSCMVFATAAGLPWSHVGQLIRDSNDGDWAALEKRMADEDDQPAGITMLAFAYVVLRRAADDFRILAPLMAEEAGLAPAEIPQDTTAASKILNEVEPTEEDA
jgi:hypothetical protein